MSVFPRTSEVQRSWRQTETAAPLTENRNHGLPAGSQAVVRRSPPQVPGANPELMLANDNIGVSVADVNRTSWTCDHVDAVAWRLSQLPSC